MPNSIRISRWLDNSWLTREAALGGPDNRGCIRDLVAPWLLNNRVSRPSRFGSSSISKVFKIVVSRVKDARDGKYVAVEVATAIAGFAEVKIGADLAFVPRNRQKRY